MPGYITHILMGELAVSEFPEEVKKLLLRYREAYFWGTQGPDPLFFHRPLLEESDLRLVGGQMHREKTGELFSYMEAYILTEPHQLKKNLLLAYYCGFLCHYFLDKTLHPYLYFQQYNLMRKTPKAFHSGIHHNLENHLDALLLREYQGIGVKNFQVRKYLVLSKWERDVLSEFLTEILRSVYFRQIPQREISAAFDQTYCCFSLLLDRCGLILPLTKGLDQLRGRVNVLSSHVKRECRRKDLLNLEGHCWHSPSQPAALSNDSVPELVDQAVYQTAQRVREVWGCFSAGISRQYSSSMENFDGNARILKRERGGKAAL